MVNGQMLFSNGDGIAAGRQHVKIIIFPCKQNGAFPIRITASPALTSVKVVSQCYQVLHSGMDAMFGCPHHQVIHQLLQLCSKLIIGKGSFG